MVNPRRDVSELLRNIANDRPHGGIEKEVISMRISTDTLQILDDKAAEIGISRNELINQMILFALANMEDPSKE